MAEEAKTRTKGGEKKLIGLDSSVAEILKYDQEGLMLYFDPQALPVLSEKELTQLSRKNAESYNVAKSKATYAEERGELDAVLDAIRANPERPKAVSRTLISNTDAKYAYVWKRKENTHKVLNSGGEFVLRGQHKEQTMNTRSDSKYHVLGSNGRDELILMRIPKATLREIDASGRKARVDLLGQVKDELVESVQRAGLKMLDTSDKD